MTHRIAVAVIAVLIIAGSRDARADDDDDEFIPLDSLGQVGLGAIIDRVPYLDPVAFDGTFRIGKVWRADRRVMPGGFLEFRTISFEDAQVAVGPQLQVKLSDLAAVQLRGGVGASTSGDKYAVAGAQIGCFMVGLSITARRSFVDDTTTVTAGVELGALLALAPVAALWVAAGNDSF